MPKRTDIKKILIIGAGPIVIGQACEFDYSGSQACRALLAEDYEVVLVNSNPATIMTDPNMATSTYIEPITPEIVEKIIAKDRPDAILPTMGGQTALNTAFELYKNGVLEKYSVELIGANFKAIHAAEDREAFKEVVAQVGLESLRSETVNTLEEAKKVKAALGLPLIIRPAFTLGGSGGGIVYTEAEFESSITHGLAQSPVNQVLLEESALGWKEYEYEVMRDSADNVVIVCSVENMDPMGVHTGDSITVAPAQTLSDKEYHILRNASIDIIRAVGVDAGGCNIQFAIHPTTGRVIVIEMNPRVSRSSALVSKATGVPIAKISARLAVGMTLDEIPNDITQNTPACFEPAIDYVVTKIPRFSFEKFPGAPDLLSPQMKSVGEVMAIGQTFQESFQKALRGLETNLKGFLFNPLDASECSVETLKENLLKPTSIRIRWIYRALFHGVSTADIYDWTGIDPWFLENLRDILDMETTLRQHTLSTLPTDLFKTAKIKGFSDAQIAEILSKKESTTEEQVRQARRQAGISVNYKSVDTCAGEFEAYTPYFYSSYDGVENEAPTPDVSKPNKRVMILGGGPNRIGQGIEFDYCCVKAALTLRELGYEAIMVNSNPETVSTDYDISDRLYFEPLTPEDVSNLLQQEKPLGVFAQLGGQTPLKLARALEEEMPILGTSSASIDLSEDRDKFKEIINTLGLLVPQSGIAFSEEEAVAVANDIGYPLIARPSYVLGGRAMRIFYNEEGLKNYLKHIVKVEPDHPVLIERFLERAVELDVDAVSDGDETMVGAILQHIEHAGVHSGDSACVWPAQNIDNALEKEVKDATAKLAKALNVVGLMNIQFAVKDGSLYVLEVNPRASRTVPFVCKATGIPLIQIGTQVMLGEKLKDIVKPYDIPNHVAVKAPVFPFIKFKGFDPMLGPEMRSTGEVMGIDTKFPAAFAKAMLGAGHKIPTSGQVFFSVNDTDKEDCLEVAKMFLEMDFSLVATSGTAAWLAKHQLPVTVIKKKHEGSPNAEELILEGRVNLLVNSPIGEEALTDDSYIRKAAVANNVPFATTITTAKAMAEAIAAVKQHSLTPKNLQENLNLIKQPT